MSFTDLHVYMEYENAEGESSDREIVFKKANGDSFTAFCHNRNSIRTFRFDRILSIYSLNHEYIDTFDWTSYHQGDETTDYSNMDFEDDAITVAFTGVNKKIRDTYSSKLDLLGYIVEPKVDHETTYLVCGERSNPKIVRKSERYGVKILSLEQFDTLMETGELAEPKGTIVEEAVSTLPVKKDGMFITFIGWVMSLTILVCSVFLFFGSIIGGIVGVVGGLLCLPPVVRSMRESAKTEEEQSKITQGSYICVGLVLLVIAVSLTLYLSDDNKVEVKIDNISQ